MASTSTKMSIPVIMHNLVQIDCGLMGDAETRSFYKHIQLHMSEEGRQAFRDTPAEKKTEYLAMALTVEPLTCLYKNIEAFYANVVNGHSRESEECWKNIIIVQEYFNMTAYSANTFANAFKHCVDTMNLSGLAILSRLSDRPGFFTRDYLENQYSPYPCPDDVCELFFPETRPLKKRAIMSYIS
jgi:hypothetical protein